MTTSRQINAAIKKEAMPIEFIGTRGGYHYFITDNTMPYDSHSVYTCYVKDLTIEQWMEHAREFMNIISAR